MDNPSDNKFSQAANNELQNIRTRRQHINDQIDELIARRDQIEQLEIALQHFLAVAGHLPTDDSNSNWPSALNDRRDASEEKGGKRHPRDAELADLVFNILDRLGGRQMHYKEVVQEVAATGWPFTDNQASREAWVNRVLNRDGRFIRPSKRGRYSLKKYYPNVTRSVGERQRMTR